MRGRSGSGWIGESKVGLDRGVPGRVGSGGPGWGWIGRSGVGEGVGTSRGSRAGLSRGILGGAGWEIPDPIRIRSGVSGGGPRSPSSP